MALVVVVCGKICGKIGEKKCWIGTKIGVVVDMDPMIMIVVTKRQKDQRGQKKDTPQELEQGVIGPQSSSINNTSRLS